MMNLNSKYFDRIRISGADDAAPASDAQSCEWHGCQHLGGYRAPKGRDHEGQYYNLCLDHVREYNKSYNYFAGMKDDDVVAYQRSASLGHRPTWTMGVNSEGNATGQYQPNTGWAHAFSDPFGIFGGGRARRTPGSEQAAPEPERRPLRNLERKSFAALDLEGDEGGVEIKARYKALVRQLHPDANGGDRSGEDRLRQIIQAYHYLRSVGFC
jgi:curved DNA-binding protein CbpA